MTEKKSTVNVFEQHLTQTVFNHNGDLTKKLPNLAPEDCELVVYNTMGFQLSKKGYFRLEFPIDGNNHIDELRDLSNGYLEVKEGKVNMGVVNLENLQKILKVSYLEPGSVHIRTSAFS
jgi:hypothetical protein